MNQKELNELRRRFRLTKMLGRLALADVFTDITSNSIVDITGIALYLSLIVVFVFLTVQAIQKRRWN